MRLRTASSFVLLAATFAAGAIGAPLPASGNGPTAAAKALAVRIVLPDGRVVGSDAAQGAGAPSGSSSPSFAYPASGSVIVTGRIRASARVKAARTASGSATGAASNISIFNGEITADSASASATAATENGRAGGGFSGTGVVHLQALGRAHAFGKAGLGDWGYLTIAPHSVDRAAVPGSKAYSAVSMALEVTLTARHGGLPAGTRIEVGYAAVSAQTARPSPPTLVSPGDRPQLWPPVTGPLVGGVPQVYAPPLTAAPYVYPVFGASDYADQYGAELQGNGWEHGVDIFGTLGQPVVAVSTGTLYSVGWNHSAGNRLWLRDRQGNEFLYAHLSAFSTLVSNGAHVRAGQVVGFMGNTGNSDGLPTHLYFEVHPVSMLFLGADGAVDAGSYLASWRHLANLSFPVATGWAPKVPGTISAPQPAAMLIGGTDISTASGLDPASLRRALRPRSTG